MVLNCIVNSHGRNSTIPIYVIRFLSFLKSTQRKLVFIFDSLYFIFLFDTLLSPSLFWKMHLCRLGKYVAKKLSAMPKDSRARGGLVTKVDTWAWRPVVPCCLDAFHHAVRAWKIKFRGKTLCLIFPGSPANFFIAKTTYKYFYFLSEWVKCFERQGGML